MDADTKERWNQEIRNIRCQMSVFLSQSTRFLQANFFLSPRESKVAENTYDIEDWPGSEQGLWKAEDSGVTGRLASGKMVVLA